MMLALLVLVHEHCHEHRGKMPLGGTLRRGVFWPIAGALMLAIASTGSAERSAPRFRPRLGLVPHQPQPSRPQPSRPPPQRTQPQRPQPQPGTSLETKTLAFPSPIRLGSIPYLRSKVYESSSLSDLYVALSELDKAMTAFKNGRQIMRRWLKVEVPSFGPPPMRLSVIAPVLSWDSHELLLFHEEMPMGERFRRIPR